MSFKEKVFTLSLRLQLFILAILLWPRTLLANQNLGSIGQNIGDNIKAFVPAVKYGGMIVGLVILIIGIANLISANKGHGTVTLGSAIVKIVVGVLLLGIGAIAGSVSSTIFGSDEATGIDELGL